MVMFGAIGWLICRCRRHRCVDRVSAGKTIYNRLVCWSRLGVFNNIFAELRRKGGKLSRLIALAASLLKKGPVPRRIRRTIGFRMVGRD
jgi:hypothetical protein